MTQDILNTIIAKKKSEIIEQSAEVSLETLKELAINSQLVASSSSPEKMGFAKALKSKNTNPKIIAEVKFGSPAKGFVRPDLEPASVATAYAENSATCLSILTDRTFFNGSLAFLPLVKEKLDKLNFKTPILRKDFIIDPYQVWQTKAMLADAILLILSAFQTNNSSELEPESNSKSNPLGESTLNDLVEQSLEAGLDILLEVHDEKELELALKIIASKSTITKNSSFILGINNRSLKTLEVDLKTSFNLASKLKELLPKFPQIKSEELVLISESGIKAAKDIIALEEAGFDGFLIGSSFTFQGDPGQNLSSLICDYKAIANF